MEQLLEDFSFGLFAMQTLIMIIVIFVLVKFAWKPIVGSLDSSEQGIKDALEAAEKAKAEFQNIQADNDRILKEAKEERDALLKEARSLKEQIVEEAKTEAKAEGDKLIAQAQAAIESEKKAAVAELKSQVATLSLDIAEKVLRKELGNKADQSKLVAQLLDGVKLS